MSNFVPEKVHFRYALLSLFNKKRQLKVIVCCSKHMVNTLHRLGHELLDDGSTQTQQQLAKALNESQETIIRRIRATGKINNLGKWVPHDLSERQMENRKVTCEMLLQRHERNSFLYRIVTGDEKWIYYENPKWKKYRRSRSFNAKAKSLRQEDHALCLVGPERNAPSHTAKPVKDTLKSLGWEIRPHLPYFLDLGPSDYHLFASMGHALSEQHFSNFEEVGKWLVE
ncbi:mariner Mos1 transposase [Trichonephila clavipes]|nr:mariner Mos1 transposase [Trichonephila clavipes]